ncbi:Quinone oxidoreductase [Candidatus Rhodobacter oscarellae]|uniref:Quinone oxidoreductase n=1 Tax=Candidatus Rhodobacter oscarellae TaxID=1675527 RepID=A0A0J9E8Z8_9RHOB|nr:NADPH:quinone oxidoreductase family protein [Candidatus Rhodobacter lobularis]KMW58134.1 Quinone oxidoreductase [Candidatus Rhodobacter lobularis]
MPFAMMSHEVGGPETLRRTEITPQAPGKGQVRIAVKAAGVNFPDTIIIRDMYQFKPPRPFAPGGEVAGVVEAVGEGVEGLAPGDRVAGLTMYAGGFATHANVPAGNVFKIPQAMPFDEAACLLFTYGTSYYGLRNRGRLQEGETLLVLGAAGGIGASAVELGKAMGARVIAAVSSDEKAAFCRGIGADDTIVYPREMDRAAQKAFGGEIKAKAKAVDVVYDPVGGDYAEPCIRAMNWDGRFLVVGFPAGIPTVPFNLPLLKNCSITGVFWGAHTMREPELHQQYMRELIALYEAGKIRPRVSEWFALEQATEALMRIETRAAQGKIALLVEE